MGKPNKTDGLSRRAALLRGGALAGLALSGAACARKMPPELDSSYKFYCLEGPEITEPGKLIGPDGKGRCGWMRKPLLDLNLEDARFYAVPYFQRFRHKEWDMYYMITPTHYLHFLVAWIGYGAFCDVAVYDRELREWKTGIHIRGPRPKVPMMRNSTEGVTEYQSKKANARFEVDGEWRKLRVDFPEFAGEGLTADLEFKHPGDHDSICGSHLANPYRVYYGEKITSMEAHGSFSLGDAEFRLDPHVSYGLLDFGRGHYPPKKFWYWATASGRAADGAVVGWNLGHGNNREETMENSLFYNGKIQKMGSVHVELDFEGLLEPWRVYTDDGRVDLTITPENLRQNDLDLGYLYAIGRPVMGPFNGFMVLDSGKKVVIEDVFGLFEMVDQRW